MNILIDLQSAQGSSRFRGIGKYCLDLVKTIVSINTKHDISLLLTSAESDSIDFIKNQFSGLVSEDSIYVCLISPKIRYAEHALREDYHASAVARCAMIRAIDPDVVLVTSHFEGFVDHLVTDGLSLFNDYPHAMIMYDLIPAMNPEMYLAPNKEYAEFYLNKIDELSKYSRLLAISESARNEAIDFACISAEKVHNIGAAANPIFKKIAVPSEVRRTFLSSYGIHKEFILVAGATDPRKNHLRLIESYSLLPGHVRDKYQLAIVGKLHPGDKERFIDYAKKFCIPAGQIITTNSVSDHEMALFCNLAYVAVSPSLHEGFGLPALEALACGSVVIGSNTTSIPEVIGDEEALFDPTSATEMSKVLLRALTDKSFRDRRIAHGLKQAKLFSWDYVANKTLSVLEDIGLVKDSLSSLKKFLNSDLSLKNIKNGLVADLQTRDNFGDSFKVKLSELLASNVRDPASNARILVDVSELAHRDHKTGIQRVVRSIFLELVSDPPAGFDIVPVYGTVEGKYYEANVFKSKVLGLSSDLPDTILDFSQKDIFIGLDLQHHVVLNNTAFYERIRNVGCKVYFVIYDLLPIQLPQYFPEGTPAIHHQWLYFLATMDGALCISKAVADEMHTWLNVNGPKRDLPYKLGYFHLGADLARSIPTLGLPDNHKYILDEIKSNPSFLMVGTVEPRKGHTQALDAFELLWSAGVKANLVIVGKEGWKVEILVERLRNHRMAGIGLFWFDTATDEFLEKIYESSDCLICASEGEGFGLPIIEAAQKGIPVLTRDLPVFREVAGPTATYFSGLQPEDLAGTIKDMIRDQKFSSRSNTSIANWISWKDSKNQLLENVIESKWYRTWISDDVTRFPAGMPAMHTQCGLRCGNSMLTSGVEGFLVYGPYKSLAKGRYHVKVFFEIRNVTGKEWIDVASDGGTNKLYHTHIDSGLSGCTFIDFVIEPDHDLSDLEVRIYVNDQTDLTANMIEMKQEQRELNIASLFDGDIQVDASKLIDNSACVEAADLLMKAPVQKNKIKLSNTKGRRTR